ncbi:hypothetical protein RSOLAG22IIIB_11489 [Rhizoctonia solani]|uniref:Uncharacterized protein n=1 Tax=Rhizoctonia solani TaxID=456999 RepID=A0A0K6G849_9AGAM|nr:hypothetical protein RSOLAG22IIIB_11489 [Rhizoctonia solani]
MASHRPGAPANPQAPENHDVAPSERSASSEISSASVLATKAEFKQWATSVKLNRTITEDIPEDSLGPSEPIFGIIRCLREACTVFPRWLTEGDPEFPLSHISSAHLPLKKKLSTDLVAAMKRKRFKVNPDKDKELYCSIGTIFQSCLHVKVLLMRQNPTEMDRRISIDTLIAHICEGDGDDIVQYSTEQKLKLPKPRDFNVLTTTADGVMYLDLAGFDPYDMNAELRELGSSFVPGSIKSLQVVHCVAEYKRGGGGTNQALMGIVSGLYQKKVLGIPHQPVFGIFHHAVDIVQVLAGVWQNGWIRLYQVGSYSFRHPRQAVQFYLVIRGIRNLGKTYYEELRNSEQEIAFRIEDRKPVDEWAIDRMGSISEHNEPDSHIPGRNGPNSQSGLAHNLSILGHWDTRDRVLSYLDSMSDNVDYPESPPPYTTVPSPNRDKSILVAPLQAAGPTKDMWSHEPANFHPWLHMS